MYSEFEITREIKDIENGEDTPIRKARRLISLSRKIRKFSRQLHHGAGILRSDDDEQGAERLQQTLNCLRRLHEEARLAAFRSLKSKPSSYAFNTHEEKQAFPIHWAESREHLQTQPSYN